MSKSETTRATILAVGVQCARKGLHMVTARRIAALAGVHHSNIVYYFKSNAALLDAVADQALADGNALVVARLILEKHPAVVSLPGVERCMWLLAAAD